MKHVRFAHRFLLPSLGVGLLAASAAPAAPTLAPNAAIASVQVIPYAGSGAQSGVLVVGPAADVVAPALAAAQGK